MKNNFDRTKTATARFSTRAVAMVLFFVMLLTAIGSGSVLSAIAADLGDSLSASAEAIEAAANEALSIAKNAVTEAEENPIDRNKADLAETGYSNGGYVKGDWDDFKEHSIGGNGYTVNLSADKTYEFCFKSPDNEDHFKKDATISGSVTKYDFPKDATKNAKLHTTVAGDYTFKFNSWDGGNSSMRVDITFPEDTTPDTWTVVGSATGSDTGGQTDALFGFSWDPTLTANDMTQSGSTWTWTKNNVQLSAGTIEYKVAKNHAWDTTVPASANATQTVSAAGTYNVTVTYNGTNVSMALESVAKSTLTVQSDIANATVTATYNGTTVQEGGSISDVPAGAKVTVKVTPDSGFQCNGITSTATAATTGSGNTWYLTMPSSATTVGANIGAVTMKKVYFNNNYTDYGQVYAYVYNKDDSTKTYEYLGSYPGTVMKKLSNSNIWYIEVPSTINYIQFVSGEGYTTEELTIPWSNAYPKYTAPYNKEAPTEANGGTWGNYIYGDNNDKRTNEYTVSDGTTMSASNLFTGITATMYDYYTDGEITNNAGTATDTTTSSGWIGGIASNEYSKGTNASGWKWNPYTNLNSALSAYANNSSQPKYNVTTPLYFGNLNTKNMGASDKAVVEAYHNWNLNANNSIDLNPNSTAITGLSGKTLANDTIHYYSSGATNENGAPMAMFDEDFLSGENNQNKALATILRTSSFPVRKEENVDGTPHYEYYDDRIYYTTSGNWNDAGAWTAMYYWTSSGNGWKDSKTDEHGTYFEIPSNATGVQFVRMKPNTASDYSNVNNGYNWDNKWNQIPSSGTAFDVNSTNKGKTFKITSTSDGSLSSDKVIKSTTYTGGHTYYEFDSTDGKDNAYITNINKTSKTAKIDYYANDAVWSGGTENNTKGFFPFDYSNKGNGAKDLGFGMKLTIPFNLGENGLNEDGTPQTFDFSGDDDLWVFVDGKLVLDLGGAHARTTGSINFNTKTITAANTQAIGSATRNASFADGFNTNPNYVHTMTIYYMERGMFESNLKFGFSFHAIPNQFWIDKKIRTQNTINSGFYKSNGQNGTASNVNEAMTSSEGRTICNFEASYQKEKFTVTHKTGTTAAGATTLASGINYTIDNDTNTYTTDETGTYPIYHDLGNAFIGQFPTDRNTDTYPYFNLTETVDSTNKYVYTPQFSVWDQANNNQALPYPSGSSYGDNTNGYTFRFKPTTTVSTAIENTNIKARFENIMTSHSLSITKELTNTTDTTNEFTLQLLFDFDYTDGNNTYDQYIAYPLYVTVTNADGTVDTSKTVLSGTGTIAIKAGQTLTIDKIPENAKMKLVEVLEDTVAGYRYNGITLTKGGTTVSPTATVTKGVTFTMGNDDMYAVVSNKKPDNRYTIKYNYPSYDNLYGQQSYTVSGVFTENELKTYLKFDESGNLAFQTESLKKGFINKKAPLEDNFLQTLSFADSTIDESDGGWVDGNYSCQVTAAAITDDQVSVSFNLPYNVDTDLVAQASSGTVAKIAAQSVGAKKISCFDWYVTSGKSRDDKSGDAPVFVKAPLIIYDENEHQNYYFQYWSVKKASSYGMKAAEYTRCYDYEFNLSLFMDTVIEPVYDTTWAQKDNPPTAYDMYGRFDPEKQIAADSTNGISIAFLENSRNQYNEKGGGSRNKGDAADVIYSDFLLSFNNYAGKEQLNTRVEGRTKAGLVIEAVDYLTGSNADGFNTTIEYRNETNIATEEAKKTDIKSWVEGGAQPNGCAKSEFDVKSLDNKNRIQYYYALNNRKVDTSGNLLNTLQNRYKVFRAYAYIGDVSSNGLTNVKVSDPVYFTIYDMASNGLANNATGK